MERKDREARNAFVLYLALTIALTWPVATGLTHLVPGDFGDPLFSSWALAWDVTHLGRGWWHANIFAPHPLALAYSEHFLPQALQALPVYLLTGNPILCYNLLFLSTFVLSGFGMFEPAWTVASLQPFVLHAIDCFGPDRVLFGSNFPVDGLMRDYAGLWRAYDEITAHHDATERDAMFYGNAARLYRIR